MDKVAIFGGTFDPIHLGHAACLKHLSEKMDFDNISLVPTNINPLKSKVKPASSDDRLKMIDIALEDFSEPIHIDTGEINNQDVSYTWNTLQKYYEKYDPSQIYLVMGIDVFQDFDQWKNFSQILESTNLLVLSRPPFNRPFGKEDFPQGVQAQIDTYERGFCLLKSGRTIEFIKINSDDISSSEVRKKLKTGKSVSSSLSLAVEKYIVEKEIYPRIEPGEIEFSQLVEFCGKTLSERAMNAMAYDVSELGKLYDYTLIASATSTKQAQSLAKIIKDQVKEEYGLSPFGEEGMAEGRWVILDYGGLIIHIFYDFVRHEYHLEQLWSEGKKLNLPKANDQKAES